ncbi:Man1-Src1p-C-terminal domain-containing protein [Multifurca ochricompacta]|uniref:Man1-Src1p-C-terminal domain-containing protein n=1 Tax=Multifurca ochricompacta TaxID=376703 RepID=A0AAD4MAN2_9AGAM|nr:Man1-Src1p-C-terminal domain-containing protein [Multifurca ochricompacta]
MSRSITAAQVIELGEYLNPDFDPSTLTVNQLLGVFGFHNIKYPTPFTKPRLVQLFNDEIKPKIKQYTKERIKKENSLASDDGIKDGVTGRYLNEDNKPLRRSSRRSSRAPSVEAEPKAEAPKRRRSAQPTLGAPPMRAGRLAQPVLQESEPEDELVPRKVSRSKKNAEDAGSRTRRSSNYAEDSGWEDNNVFQSGAESSSPARPPPKLRSRKATAPKVSTTTRKPSRKASSAPPEYLSSPSPARDLDDAEQEGSADPTLSPPRSKFAPRLSPEAVRENDNIVSSVQRSPFKKFIVSPLKSFSPMRPVEIEGMTEETEEDNVGEVNLEDVTEERASEVNAEDTGDQASEVDELDELDESEDVKLDLAISQRLADGPVLRTSSPSSGTSPFLRFLIVMAILLAYLTVGPYKALSASLGYCDTGSKTNDLLEQLRTRSAAIEACNRENRTSLYLPSPGVEEESCPPPPLLPFVPDECTPCPEHATCTVDSVSCEHGFLLRPHPLLSFISLPSSNTLSPHSQLPPTTDAVLKIVSTALDGFPGLGPVAFPPRCVEDPKRKRHIGVLGKAIEAVLGLERGKRLCASEVPIVQDTEGGEAKRWGMHIGALRQAMKAKTAPQLLSTFEDTFDEAIQQLITWGGVITGEDTQGAKYIAHKTPNLDWTCAFTVKSREVWKEWRGRVFGIIVAVLGMFIVRWRRTQARVEDKRVAELVQLALAALRNQEIAHHTDPVTAPVPYLSSLQLRDLVLQDEHSVTARARLWARVEHVVEGNANVRANLEEVPGGDELRVWRWVGGSGRRKTVEYDSVAGQRIVA